MKVQCFSCGMNYTNCYIVYDKKSRIGFCVDVSDKLPQEYFDYIKNKQLKIEYLLLTHGHFDHTQDILRFHQMFPETKIVISETDYQKIQTDTAVYCECGKFVKPDIFAVEGEDLPFLNRMIRVLETPGHTPGSVCYLYQEMVFCGDTVFCGSVGRTDLPGGSFPMLLQSLQKVKALKTGTLYPGHMELTDIPTEMKYNQFFSL